jgi:6-phosphofructokinase 1
MSIAVLTSGGDSPGMNACIRAVVRAANARGITVYGARQGYDGLIDNDLAVIDPSAVHAIIHLGGTILKTARSPRFMEAEGRAKAYAHLQARGISRLIVIGGDGSYRGALALSKEFQEMQVIGLPGTIDNDLYGTDLTIGYDTAINTAMEAIDKIRDTAESHNRLFFVEVMGRDAGFIALRSGIATGADAVLIPETPTAIDVLLHFFDARWQSKRNSCIVVISEGDDAGGAFSLAQTVKQQRPSLDIKVSVLGHIQRGGSPTCIDRVLATRLGVAAVDALLRGERGLAGCLWHRDVRFIPLQDAQKHHMEPNPYLKGLVELLG